jgi:hypothetical protein
MPSPLFVLRPDRRLTGLALTVLLHVAVLLVWRAPSAPETGPDAAREAINWVNIVPRVVTNSRPPPASRPAPVPRPRAPSPAAPPQKTEIAETAIPQHVLDDVAALPSPLEPVPAAPAAATADSILQQARRDVGKIDKDLRKEFPDRGLGRAPDSPEMRLARGMEAAHDAVKPKWYQPARIREISVPGKYGSKMYKVTTALGSYCVSYGSTVSQNHTGRPVVSPCPDGV